MSLPELIEIDPPVRRVGAEVIVPGSKSITNRALILAALAPGETALRGALWSEDTQVMVECLRDLGFMVNVEDDPGEACNRTITLYGLGGRVLPGGTADQPLDLFVGNAGTAARFLAAFVCLGSGVYRLSGVPRMHERPQGSLFQALRCLGYRVDSPNDKLPALIHGGGRRAGRCQVSIQESSQFASALLLGAGTGGWTIDVLGADSEESSYVEMTARLIEAFARSRGVYSIEPDASSGSYFWAADWLQPRSSGASEPELSIRIAHWPNTGWQKDEAFRRFWPLPAAISRRRDLGDSIMTAVILGPFAAAPVRFEDLRRLRLQECERVGALRTELTRCGANVIERGDTLEIFPSALHGATIETYGDHRMAMCFAILGLKVPGVKIKNPACVKKTFPNFFQKLAAPPPAGLGVFIRDATSGGANRVLSWDELFAG